MLAYVSLQLVTEATKWNILTLSKLVEYFGLKYAAQIYGALM